jgi:hypothetical protein
MPSYLDFETSKKFRDFIIGKTLSTPNGPRTFTNDTYPVQNTRDMANIDPGAVDSNLNSELLQSQNANVFKPLEYFVNDSFNTIPRKANLELYPYFIKGQGHNIIGIMTTDTYDTESELMKFAGWYIKNSESGPFYSRIQQNLYTATAGRVRILDALEGNTATAINLITGREPLIDKNNKITVANSIVGKGVDFLQNLAGVEFPWSEIPGDYLSNPKNPVISRPVAATQAGAFFQDLTGALGSLVGIQRRPTITRKPSDLLLDYMGSGPKSTLFDNLSYSRYAPNYTTTARSQNTSKIFNFIDNAAQGVKNFLGIEAPRGVAYIGDDRGNDVKFAMSDFNDRPIRSGYYLSLMFDPIQAELFQRIKNIGEGGGIGGKLTWISSKSKNVLGSNNVEYSSEQSQFLDSLSTSHTFRDDSILGLTQQILETMPTDGGASRSHIANVIDQTSRVFREGDVMMSRGSAIKYVNQFSQQETGVEYCRVWTKDRSYMNYSDTMKRTTNSRKYESSVLSTPWNLNIYPNSNGNGSFDSSSTNIASGGFDTKSNKIKDGQGFYAKKYMFSIENLAWKTSTTPGFTYNDLPYCERGPNGGRVMWFPPYDLKVNEQNNAKWEENIFLGRPEPIYTYQNTSRGGTVTFKVIVDHPSILNLLVREHFKGMSDEEADNYINAFFAGCEDVDFYGLIRKYTTLTPDDLTAIQSYLNQNKDPNTVIKNKSKLPPVIPDSVVPKNQVRTGQFNTELYFKNDFPLSPSQTTPAALYSDHDYQLLYNEYINAKEAYIKDLNQGLSILTGATASVWDGNQKNDYKVITKQTVTERPFDSVLNSMVLDTNSKIEDGFNQLQTAYTEYNKSLSDLKSYLSGNTVQDITVVLGSRTSSIADENYNLKLSYRRSHSIISDILNKLAVGSSDATKAIEQVKWKNTITDNQVEAAETIPIIISLKDLGYINQEGNFTIQYVANIGEQPAGSPGSGTKAIDCTDANKILTSSSLKRTAPITFWCRETSVDVSYKVQFSDTSATPVPLGNPQVPENTDTSTGTLQTPPIDEMKKIIMRALSECYYFKKLEEESPLQFTSLREKLKYFHPAFHSMTPEGLNSRLTFLNQCVRPGDTLPIKGISDASDMNARNTTFGPPPILVMRIGDFYHSKIIVRDVNIDFEDNLWDLNPEGIGVQPMIANVTLQISFIGGHGLEKPVERLQNALSSNFYANTEMYDPRSIPTEDRSKFTKAFLEDLSKDSIQTALANPQDTLTAANKVKEGEYIGTINGSALTYEQLVNDLYTQGGYYFSKLSDAYNSILFLYEERMTSMMFSPTYRTIQDYTVQTDGSPVTIQLLGEYRKGYELEVLTADFKSKMLEKVQDLNISTVFGFDKDMTAGVLSRSEQILKPFVLATIGERIDSMSQFKSLNESIEIRNKIIVILDKLNFINAHNRDGMIVKDVYTGASLSGFTSGELYPKYSNVIDFIKDNQIEFSNDLDDTTYVFSKNTTMTDNDFSYFLSVLMKDEKERIMKQYLVDKTVFNSRITNDMRKRLDRFLSTNEPNKNFKFKFPARKENNLISFNFSDIDLDQTQQTELKSVLTTRGVNTVSVLNYFR